MISILPTTKEHIAYALLHKKKDVYCSESLSEDLVSAHPMMLSLVDKEGNLGAIIGMDMIHEGVGTAWAITTFHIKTYPLAYTKAVQICSEIAFKHFGLHRLQIMVKNRKDLIRWACCLGFSPEGKLEKFGTDKSDYFVMGRLKHG